MTTIELTAHEALSGILGSISLACWLFLLLPQLIENYRNGSAEAISLAFMLIWFVGDVCNLVGALWADLVGTIVAIACYFCLADGVLIAQVLYYRIKSKRREARGMKRNSAVVSVDGTGVEASGEREALLGRGGGAGDDGRFGTGEGEVEGRKRTYSIPGSMERRRSSAAAAMEASSEPLAKVLEETDERGVRLWLKNVLSVLAIVVVGTAGWGIAYGTGVWKPTGVTRDLDTEEMATGAQVLGYASAVAYLGARIPQIIKNWREKSCEGLSLLFFILSLMGNLTYGGGILCHSLNKEYVIKNTPWLIGSLGTMVEDIAIFIQFHLYRVENNEEDSAIE